MGQFFRYHCETMMDDIPNRYSGAGSGGASAAYFLDKFRDPCTPVNITVYERASYVGGRSTTVNVHGDPNQPVELGASIFVQVNRNLVNAVADLGLSIKDDDLRDSDAPPQVLGIWNGQSLVITLSDDSYSWWNAAKMIWKYGLLSITRNRALVKQTVGTFLRMYEEPHFPFRSLSEAAYDLGLTKITGVTGTQFLKANRIGSSFSTEIIQASTRVNYAQNLDQIHGLETMVCMAIDGQMSVQGGNWQIFDGMIKASQANLRLNTSVTEILRQPDSTYTVKASLASTDNPESSSTYLDLYDTVILAGPLQFANISFNPVDPRLPAPIPYVSLHVTLFTSPHVLSPAAFNISPPALAPTVILTTLPPGSAEPLPFFSISTLRSIRTPTGGAENLYKVFSPAPLTPSFFAHILGISVAEDNAAPISAADISWLYTKIWHSYPYLRPRVTFDDPQLDQAGRLWYTSGIEGFISTMETSSLMGMNVAKLVVNGWETDGRDRCPSEAVTGPGETQGGRGWEMADKDL